MPANPRLSTCVFRGAAWLASALLLAGIVARPAAINAQTQFLGDVCSVPPDTTVADGWPKAMTDSLGTVTGATTFAGAFLASNDVGSTALTVTGVTPSSERGATIAVSGAGLYTYTPAAGFAGNDVFTYQVSDTKGQTASGLVRVSVIADVTAPSVSITSPAAGATVSGVVTLTASASDNVAVAGVKFFDGATQIGPEVTAPFTASWNTSAVADGLHSLTAVARDASGNAATSAAVSVTVANRTTVPNIVGSTDADARAAIAAANLVVGTVTSANSSVPVGQVISQDPAAGGSVLRNSAVSYVLSLGPAVTPVDGLVLALGFDEASGTTALDSSTSAKNGTIKQAVRVPGKFGGALKFDGVDDWVTVADTTASPLDLSTGMTLEAWVNPTVMSGWETVLYKERGIAGEGLLCYALYAHDGAPLSLGQAVPAGYVRLNNATQTSDKAVRGTTKLALNTWTHIATTYDGAVQKFYVNGVLVGTANPIVAPSLNTIVQSNGALRIGGNASSTGEFFQGLIDEVRVYNRALSVTEIARDMNTPVR